MSLIPRLKRTDVENRVVLDLAIVEPYAPDPADLDRHDRAVTFLGRARFLVEQQGGVCGPVRPGNATFTFAITDADAALNAAIRIQEIAVNEPAHRIRCAIGLATGSTRQLEGDSVSVLGDCVTDAHHLAEAANAGAVLADLDTLAAANLFEVRSSTGEQQNRTHREYVTPVGYLPVAGTSAPLAFVEVVWDEHSRGIRTTALRDVAWWHLGEHVRTANRDTPAPSEWEVGRVRSWNPSRRHGFIVSSSGEFFYVDDRFIVGGDSLVAGSEVWFVPKPALIAGKNRLATTVVAGKSEFDAQLVMARGDLRFTEVVDTAGNRAELPCDTQSEAGDIIVGRVDAGKKGEPVLH